MSGISRRLTLPQLPRNARWILAGFLSAAGIGYFVTLLLAYVQVTTPNSLWPNFRDLDAVFFGREKPVGPIERLLVATEGPMNGNGTMRPAFTDQSSGWEALTKTMTAEEKTTLSAEREGERLALLAWVRSGPNREAYEANDFPWDDESVVRAITAAYLKSGEKSPGQGSGKNVRIRTLIDDRCVICHGENGREEKASWIPLDSWEHIEWKCRRESTKVLWPTWLIGSLIALLPLTLLAGRIFYFSSHPAQTRLVLTALPFVALAAALGSWLIGRLGTYSIHLLLGASAVAATGVMIQIIASLGDLFSREPA